MVRRFRSPWWSSVSDRLSAERYTAVERSQHILQSDTRVFGQSYVANCSSVDGQSAFLGEAPDHSPASFFQGYGQFCEPGAPTELPAAVKTELRTHPEVVALQRQVHQCLDGESRRKAKKALQAKTAKLEKEALKKYRHDWVRQRRDWKVTTRGKISNGQKEVPNVAGVSQERQNIARQVRCDVPQCLEDMRRSIEDAFRLCTSGDIFYYPGEEPLDGLCPFCKEPVNK